MDAAQLTGTRSAIEGDSEKCGALHLEGLWFSVRIMALFNGKEYNKMYTQRRLTQLYIYLSLATGFSLTDHLQALVSLSWPYSFPMTMPWIVGVRTIGRYTVFHNRQG